MQRRHRWIQAVLWASTAVAAATWLFASTILFVFQDQLVFPVPPGLVTEPPAGAGPGYRLEHVETSDGLVLGFWATLPKPGMPTIINFHGNGARAQDSAVWTRSFADQGYGVILAEYRGYGGNPGQPSEEGFDLDARAYVAWASREWGSHLPFVVGESIGSGVATRLATEIQISGLVLDSPFTSLAAVVRAGPFWWAPTFLLATTFDNLSRIAAVNAPVLIVRGEDDRLMPVSHAPQLIQAARCPLPLVSLPGVPHLAIGNDPSGRAKEAIAKLFAATLECWQDGR